MHYPDAYFCATDAHNSASILSESEIIFGSLYWSIVSISNCSISRFVILTFKYVKGKLRLTLRVSKIFLFY